MKRTNFIPISQSWSLSRSLSLNGSSDCSWSWRWNGRWSESWSGSWSESWKVYAVRDFVISTKGNGPIFSNSEEELEKLKNGPS